MKYGYVRVAAAVPKVKVADCTYNVEQIVKLSTLANEKHVEIIIFPELSITGYTCGDLFAQSLLLVNAEKALQTLLAETRDLPLVSIVGMPVRNNGQLINTAVIIQRGEILGVVPKTFLPNYKEFYEKRWFASSLQIPETEVTVCGQTVPMRTNLLFNTGRTTFGVEICEDLWAPVPPS